jgi:hypothetical protein
VCPVPTRRPFNITEEDPVLKKRRWADLSPRTRRLVLLGAAVEGVLKIMALVDIKRRPALSIRGSKLKWAIAVILVNSAGALPIAYFVVGRRHHQEQP